MTELLLALACSPKEDPLVDSLDTDWPEEEPDYWCFVAGTRIATPDGPRAIETLQVGDVVWAYDLATLRRVERPVTALHRNRARARRVEVGERVIQGVSAEHPFWSDGRWVPAGELREGDPVHVWNGVEATERGITRIVDQPGIVEVFNLTVAGEHTYFAEGILVHNKSDSDVDSDMDTDIDDQHRVFLSGDSDTMGVGAYRIEVFRGNEKTCQVEWATTGIAEASSCPNCVFAWATEFAPGIQDGDCEALGIGEGDDITAVGLKQGRAMGWANSFEDQGNHYNDVWVMFLDDQWRPWAHGEWDGTTASWSRRRGEDLH